MPPVELLLPFFVATLVFAFIPGPGMFYMSIQTMARGRKAGWLSAAGFHLGAYLHILGAAFGISVVLTAAPVLFTLLKLLAAGYLVWMGVRMVGHGGGNMPVVGPLPDRTGWQAFRDSLAVEVLNPKTALFFLAFLLQFASPQASAPLWLQIVVLGFLANAAFSLTDAVCIAFSERLVLWASASRTAARIGRRIGGSLFIAMGMHLAFRNE